MAITSHFKHDPLVTSWVGVSTQMSEGLLSRSLQSTGRHVCDTWIWTRGAIPRWPPPHRWCRSGWAGSRCPPQRRRTETRSTGGTPGGRRSGPLAVPHCRAEWSPPCWRWWLTWKHTENRPHKNGRPDMSLWDREMGFLPISFLSFEDSYKMLKVRHQLRED